MTEIWRSLSFNSRLSISNFGRLRSNKNSRVWKVRTTKSTGGYPSVSIYNPSTKKSRQYRIHRLVAEHFIPKIVGKNQVNHKDFDKTNNHVSNLEWCTHKENIAHYYKHKYGHVMNADIALFIRQNIEKLGATKLANMFNLSMLYVLGVANGTHYSHVHLEYIRDKRPSLPVPVKKYDLKYNFIEEYDSQSSAANKNNIRLSALQRVLSGERKSHKGFIYESSGYKRFVLNSKTIGTSDRKRVAQYTTTGQLIKTYKSKSEAAKLMGLSKTSIRDAISGRVKTAKGYIFRYADKISNAQSLQKPSGIQV